MVREQQEVNAALRTENESLFEDLEAAKDKASTLQNEVRSANEENERLKLEISSLLQQLDEARRREGESTRRIEVLQREREQLEDELRRLRGEGEELSSVLEVAAMETQVSPCVVVDVVAECVCGAGVLSADMLCCAGRASRAASSSSRRTSRRGRTRLLRSTARSRLVWLQ